MVGRGLRPEYLCQPLCQAQGFRRGCPALRQPAEPRYRCPGEPLPAPRCPHHLKAQWQPGRFLCSADRQGSREAQPAQQQAPDPSPPAPLTWEQVGSRLPAPQRVSPRPLLWPGPKARPKRWGRLPGEAQRPFRGPDRSSIRVLHPGSSARRHPPIAPAQPPQADQRPRSPNRYRAAPPKQAESPRHPPTCREPPPEALRQQGARRR